MFGDEMIKDREIDGEPVDLKSGMHRSSGRRDFLRCCGRFVFISIGTVAGSRFFRRNQVSATGAHCVNGGICSSCRTYHGCDLPQAVSRRNAIEAGGNDRI